MVLVIDGGWWRFNDEEWWIETSPILTNNTEITNPKRRKPSYITEIDDLNASQAGKLPTITNSDDDYQIK